MSEHEWKAMNDRDFDAMLTESVSELPPDDITEGVTPWRRAMNRILFGFALSVITIKILGLDYILPAVGMVLLLLGFRTLRRENGWFGTCFVIAVLRAVGFFADFILNSTIYKNEILPPGAQSVITAVCVVLLLVQILCFWRGLCAVKRKAGLPPTAGAAFAFFMWYAIGCFAALMQLEGLIIVGALLVSYIFIIVSLCKLSKVLDEAGYTVKPAAVKVTDLCIVLVISAVVLLGCAAGYIFGGSYDMDWQPEKTAAADKTQEIRAHLLDLGFPEDVLNDLTEEDISACDGAEQVLVDVTVKPANGEALDMTITSVGVHVPGEADEWAVFRHFVWNSNPGFVGTETLQLWPGWRYEEDGWSSDLKVTGRVLYDKGGVTYAAPYYRLAPDTYLSQDVMMTPELQSTYFADFTMPNDGERCRGYIAYHLYGEFREFSHVTDCVMYTHQTSRWQYPVLTARENRMSGAYLTDGAFFTVVNHFLFGSDDNGGYSAASAS